MPLEVSPTLAELTFERVETDAGLDAVLEVRNVIDPEPITRATLVARTVDDVVSHAVVFRADGRAVSAAWTSWTAWMKSVDEAIFRIWVLPEWRGRGIGSRLFEDLRAFAVENGIRKAVGKVLADDVASLAFLRNRGLVEFGRQQLGFFDLDLAREAAPVGAPDGITLASIAERPDLERAVYDLESTTLPEVPSLADIPPPSWEDWSTHLTATVYQRDLSLVALEGDVVVGSIQVDDDGEGDAFIVMLSVAPAMRRRGIARALKQELARRAAAAGWKHLVTQNDGTNDAVRGLNEQLGYRYLPVGVLVQGPLSGA